MGDVNELPIEVLVVLCGIGVVILAGVLVRFGGKIAKGMLVLAGIVLAGVVALAALTQAGANFEQSRATVEVAKVAQVAESSNLVLIAFTGCIAGIALVSIVALAGVAVFLWYKLQLAGQHQVRQRPAMLPQVAQSQLAPGYAGDFDLSWLDNDNWVEQGEQLWKSNESFHW